MPNIITINGLALVGLLKLAAKKDVRYCLNAIKIEATPERTRLVATNGHVLGIYETVAEKSCPNEVPGGYYEGIIPRAVLEKLRVSRKEHTLTLTVSEGSSAKRDAILSNYGTEIKFQTIDGQFPDYSRVIPESVTGEAGMYNPELLNMFAGMAKALGGTASHVGLHQNGHGTALVTLYNCPGFVGVIMPMRASDFNETAHLWARASLKPAAESTQAAT